MTFSPPDWLRPLPFLLGSIALVVPILRAGTAGARPEHAGPTFDEKGVQLEKKGRGYRLLRGGEPYFIKGAGGQDHLEQLAAAGGNSIRTWGVGSDTKRLLDAAHEAGLTVTLGIWLARVGEGFDYGNERDLERQTRAVREAVRRYKDHPAMLLWGIGNEMEGDGRDPRVYEHLEALASMVKALDPLHPTMTVIAELGEGAKKIKDLDRLAPSIDIIGINSYGAIESVPKRYRSAGGRRPYVITEHGPIGHWECPRSKWGSPIEASSTEKTERYRIGYEKAVQDQPLCLGAYTFLWGQKQETTATWYGMFLEDGTRLGAIDTMTELWSGKPPKNRAPEIKSLKIDRDELEPGETLRATVVARDPDRDDLEIEWVLRAAATRIGSWGAREERLEGFPRAILSAKGRQARVRAPGEPGPYRLFVHIRDGEGNGAVHNVPLLVKP